MTKEQTLAHWRAMKKRLNPLRHMAAIPYKSKGSSYGACGIRIDGSPAFIDAVLSNLTELLDGENAITRLELSRSKVDGSKLGKAFTKADTDAEVCYIRLHQRGGDAVMMNRYDHKLMAATERHARLFN